MPRIPPELCAKCKGYKRLCGLPYCPILQRFRASMSTALRVEGRSVEGATPPGVLVGERGYPAVRLYLFIPPGVSGEEARIYDAPQIWAGQRLTLARIISLRSSILGASLRADARDPYRLYETEIGLAALSERPVDAEAELRRPPVPRLRFDGLVKPVGPTAPAERVRVSSSPRLPPSLEKAIWDDARASDIVWELYRSGVDIYSIQRAFSLGFLGRPRSRRIVPTRWSITAVDEILSGRLRAAIRGLPEIGEAELYYGEYLGNRFIIVLLPGPGSIEWIEAWHPRTVWTRHGSKPVVYRLVEDPLGRKTAEDGGYSAAKLGVLEHLYNRGRRADAVIIREILPSYYAPVGNWHIRETVRRAMREGPIARAPGPEGLQEEIERRLDLPGLARESRLLGLGGRRQSRLDEFPGFA
ncbi:MAG: Nre family DNA repair protein [Desulfurococcales archaeon]|nr:Nre family DNA repair protein [Desulfurococcales archaeon]